MESTIKIIDKIKAPIIRGDCRNIPRPCPFIRCKWHVLWVNSKCRFLLRKDDDVVADWVVSRDPKYSCVLDIADRGEATLEEIAQVMNITRERVGQIEGGGKRKKKKGSAFAKLRHPIRREYLKDFLSTHYL